MRFEVRVEHVPWKPVTRADLGPAPSVTRVSVGPGNAHVRVAVQASQDRQGHTRPAKLCWMRGLCTSFWTPFSTVTPSQLRVAQHHR